MIHVRQPGADYRDMSISAVSGSSAPLPSDVDRQVAVMKKARDVEKATAEALLELVKQAPQRPVGGLINVLA
jgi:hypothetical protein